MREVQNNYPELKSRTYGAPALYVKGLVRNYSNTYVERCRHRGDPFSL